MKISASHEPWAKADLFFLNDALRRGMPAERVAGFLGRQPDEVQAKARELEDEAQRIGSPRPGMTRGYG
jgi:hypothetical protein